ncbi:terminase large subunit [Ruminococcaceae bacterium OttesenSCG-928-I18]|nr:terminase large subunit [Ruminococcaceae bacterium OttesenSCG-928-I18]
MNNPIYAYYQKIKDGQIVVGEWIHAIFKILVKGIEDGTYTFNAKKATRAIRFIEGFCHHCKGRTDLIRLELWQKAIVSAMFGIVDNDDVRVFREVVIVVSRKQGKSIFAAAVACYMAYLDGEYGAEVFCLAPKLDQAGIVYDNIHQTILQEPELSQLAKKRRSDIYISESNTIIKPIDAAENL